MKVIRNVNFKNVTKDYSQIIESYADELLNSGFVIAQDPSLELQYKVCEGKDHVEIYINSGGYRSYFGAYDVLDIKVQYAIIGTINSMVDYYDGVCSKSDTFEIALQLLKVVQNFERTTVKMETNNYTKFKEERQKFFVKQGFLLSEQSLDKLFFQNVNDNKVTFWKNDSLSHIQKIITLR